MIEVLILQNVSSHEVRACLGAAMVMPVSPRVLRSDIQSLWVHQSHLKGGQAMPVGSVEFVREAMRVAGIEEPSNLSYPEPLRDFLLREVRLVPAGEVLGTWFVKPARTKAFTGFVFDTLQDPDKLGEHDREQYDAFMALPAGEEVWISEPVEFVSEWRYYVRGGRVIGSGRYDMHGEDSAATPDPAVVNDMVKALPFDHPCAVDVGVLSSGETALVEVNDAWALGLYGGSVAPAEYLELLAERWRSLLRHVIS